MQQSFLIHIMMERLEENINASRQAELVQSDKFDRHMKQARERDIENRKMTFCEQSEQCEQRRARNAAIVPSVY